MPETPTSKSADNDSAIDIRTQTDRLRHDAPVVTVADGTHWVLGHAEAVAVAQDAERYSSAVSRHVHVPNGLDGQAHADAREALDVFFTPEALDGQAEQLTSIVRRLLATLPRGTAVDAVHDIGSIFAVRAQSAWLGWPAELEEPLLAWMADNHASSRSGDRAWTNKVAEDFNEIVRSVALPRLQAGDDAPDDVTTALTKVEMGGRRISEDELVSVLRNWTGGDLGSIALCTGVICVFLATHPEVQDRLRAGVSAREFDAILDEILRIDDPFVSNRRVATCPVELGGQQVAEGDSVVINWTSANRDESVFGDPDAFAPDANAANNLVYGTGPHVCPGRPLATLELRILTTELLAATTSLSLVDDEPPTREEPPLGGYSRVPLILG